MMKSKKIQYYALIENGAIKASFNSESHLAKEMSKGTVEITCAQRDALLGGDRLFGGELIGKRPSGAHAIKNKKWVVDSEKRMAIFRYELEAHIYSQYPAAQQAQDEKWTTSFATKLKASGVKDLELQIVTATSAVIKGAKLSTALKDVPKAAMPYYEKLVSVAVRTEWAEQCVIAAKKAFAAGKEPKYPAFFEVKK